MNVKELFQSITTNYADQPAVEADFMAIAQTILDTYGQTKMECSVTALLTELQAKYTDQPMTYNDLSDMALNLVNAIAAERSKREARQ